MKGGALRCSECGRRVGGFWANAHISFIRDADHYACRYKDTRPRVLFSGRPEWPAPWRFGTDFRALKERVLSEPPPQIEPEPPAPALSPAEKAQEAARKAQSDLDYERFAKSRPSRHRGDRLTGDDIEVAVENALANTGSAISRSLIGLVICAAILYLVFGIQIF
jgi:hypothetical protein